MGALLCFLRPCRWQWLCDVMAKSLVLSKADPLGEEPHQTGLYQCTRCKAISLGAPRG
jgi:hypothetical protein